MSDAGRILDFWNTFAKHDSLFQKSPLLACPGCDRFGKTRRFLIARVPKMLEFAPHGASSKICRPFDRRRRARSYCPTRRSLNWTVELESSLPARAAVSGSSFELSKINRGIRQRLAFSRQPIQQRAEQIASTRLRRKNRCRPMSHAPRARRYMSICTIPRTAAKSRFLATGADCPKSLGGKELTNYLMLPRRHEGWLSPTCSWGHPRHSGEESSKLLHQCHS